MSARDLLLVNAKVTTLDASSPAADAVLVREGRFHFVGTEADARRVAKDPRVIDLGRRRVIPA